MFAYCTEVLGLAEGAAFARIEVARAVRRTSRLLECLADGSLSLTTIRRLSPILTPENRDRLIAEARGKSSRAVEALVARERPKPDVPPTIRRLPEVRSLVEEDSECDVSQHVSRCVAQHVAQRVGGGDLLTAGATTVATCSSRSHGPTPSAQHIDDRRRPSIQASAPERYRVQFTAGAEMRERIRRLQDLLRHRIPDGDLAAVVDLALIDLLAKLEKRKCGAVTKRTGDEHRSTEPVSVNKPVQDRKTEASSASALARPTRTIPRSNTRTIPRPVRFAVWRRDAGRCRFVSDDGRACSATGFLEFHHVVPFAHGGGATEANLQLRCRAHNAQEAELAGLGRRAPRSRRYEMDTSPSP